jgi:hypothetical protein
MPIFSKTSRLICSLLNHRSGEHRDSSSVKREEEERGSEPSKNKMDGVLKYSTTVPYEVVHSTRHKHEHITMSFVPKTAKVPPKHVCIFNVVYSYAEQRRHHL